MTSLGTHEASHHTPAAPASLNATIVTKAPSADDCLAFKRFVSAGGNGCGSDATVVARFARPLVPQGFGSISFSEACNRHDICYITPGQNRAACDRQFRRDLARSCDQSTNHFERVGCHVTAAGMSLAVKTFGAPSYKAGQLEARDCPGILNRSASGTSEKCPTSIRKETSREHSKDSNAKGSSSCSSNSGGSKSKETTSRCSPGASNSSCKK
ncbi:hypothetical protein [Gemmata algarum]|uniref:hypothetical protein n=1 Tax=Gemmata algarum TaxID=2975278 RepID=UPI0039C9D803